MRAMLLPLLFSTVFIPAFSQVTDKGRMIKGVYEEVGFEDLIHRYFGKDRRDPVEGIYSVSCVITRRSKRLLSKREKIRVMERKDNYARVALLRDWPEAKRDYIEVSLSYRDAKKYPVVGQLQTLAESRSFIYRHFEPDGSTLDFSMINESPEMLEAEFSHMKKRKTVTYKLSYLKIYPKGAELTVDNDIRN